ncbi:uncharacterized protein NPIL_411151 [Nephila pilipes]|uniref:Uncharacterized protein n=1 Tax=Nephila pilipes TaxID=299642 RepID=A0A8X6JPJ1_NEPPI|nr:uncharacterized protein NPIL_411151 [Nephila pilipes]
MASQCGGARTQFGIQGDNKPTTGFGEQLLCYSKENVGKNCLQPRDSSRGDSSSPPLWTRREGRCLCCTNGDGNIRKPARIIYYEIPKPKFRGISVTERDYKVHTIQKREIPAWHPKRSQPWRRLTIPCENMTTYKKDFQPPPPRLLHRRTPATRNRNSY